MLLYITDGGFKSLTPHYLPSTVMMNEVRRLMRQLAESTINFGQILRDNLVTLEAQEHLLSSHKVDLDKLMSNLDLKSQISTKEQEIKDAKLAHRNSQTTVKELEEELQSFIKLIVRFEYLMNHLRITSSKGEYYEKYLLESKKSLEQSANGDNYFKEMLEFYKKEKNTADKYFKYWKTVEGPVAEVQNLLSEVEEFHKLPHFEEIIKNSVDTGRLKDAVEQWLKTE